MIGRLSVVAITLLCAACASEPIMPGLGLGAIDGSALTGSALSGVPAADEATQPKKTLSERVLAAIALEHVTGRKPDPQRLIDGN